MKIAVVVNELNIRGGTHKQVLRLCQYLKSKNIEFVLCTKYFEKEKTYLEFGNFDILYLKTGICSRRAARLNLFRRVSNFIASSKENRALFNLIPNDADVVNVHDVFLEPVIKLATKNGKKVVWQINDLDPAFVVGTSKFQKDTIYKKCKRIWIKNIAKNVDKITVNVTKNKFRIKDLLNKDSDVLYCGVDRNDTLIKHSFKMKKEFKLLSMGVFFSYRNYETLIKVIKKMREQGIKISLNIIGSTDVDKDYSSKIYAMVNEYNMGEIVKICGQVDDKTYTDLFNDSDAFAFINIDQSWGLAVFEAMSCGLPVIVSNSVGATELLRDGIDSIIVNPLDVETIEQAIKRLMIDKYFYNELSNNAFRVVKEYTWDEMYSSKLVDIFKQL